MGHLGECMKHENKNSFEQTNSQFTDEKKYSFDDKEFIVRSIFKNDCRETVGTILLRLIKNEIE